MGPSGLVISWRRLEIKEKAFPQCNVDFFFNGLNVLIVYFVLVLENQTRPSALFMGLSFEL